MKQTEYNPTGKKMTWEQHIKERKKQEEAAKKKKEAGKPWLCRICKKSNFKLAAKGGLIYRTCKGCGDVATF